MEEVVHWRCALEGNILFSVPFLYTSWLPGGKQHASITPFHHGVPALPPKSNKSS